jgi:hypothetical protein
MSSRRDLKKDIDYLVFEVIADCFAYSEVHQDKNADELSGIIADSVSLRNDLIARVNNPDGKDNPKILKAFYRDVEKDLMEGVHSLFERLSALSAKKK